MIFNYRASLNLSLTPIKLWLLSTLHHPPPFIKASLTKVLYIYMCNLMEFALYCVWPFIAVAFVVSCVWYYYFFLFACFHLRQGIAISPSACSNVLPALAFWAAAACFAAAYMLWNDCHTPVTSHSYYSPVRMMRTCRIAHLASFQVLYGMHVAVQ